MSEVLNTQFDNQLSTDDKKEYLRKAAQMWDRLTERQKGRLEGKLEAFELFSQEEKRPA